MSESKEKAVPEDVIEELGSIANNYEVLHGSYVIPKLAIDLFIERLEQRNQRINSIKNQLGIINHTGSGIRNTMSDYIIPAEETPEVDVRPAPWPETAIEDKEPLVAPYENTSEG